VGLGFAIPINNAKGAIDDFINSGEVSYGWLGVSLIDADRDTLQALGLEGKRGALAAQVFIDSPADKGGIQPGDFITRVDGKEARDSTTLSRMVGDIRAGDRAGFTVFRGGQTLELTVRIEARNNETAAEGNKLWPGLLVAPINDAIRAAFNFDKDVQGLAVTQLVDKSPASVVGLQRGDRITGLNGEKVNDLAAFYRLLREKTSRELWFEVIRGENTLETLKFKR
jgi:S1-C subfamily serine protease